MDNNDESLESCTIRVLLSHSKTTPNASTQDVLPKFSIPLKTNFEDRSLWLRFGLTLSLSNESPQSALQAFHECLRIDKYDPLPAMLAAKLLVENLNDIEQGIQLMNEAIRRCQNLLRWADTEKKPESETNGTTKICQAPATTTNSVSGELLESNSNSSNVSDKDELESSQDSADPFEDSAYLDVRRRYKNIKPTISRCYLLAGIMHAHIYEREPESMKSFHEHNLSSSLSNFELSSQFNSDDYLLYFHKALHDARDRKFSEAIDNLHRAIKLNPHHVPSIRLLLLSLSALGRYDEALNLCQSTLYEFEDDLLLLYIKCNLERCLGETKGYKLALDTVQHMLKCIRKNTSNSTSSLTRSTKTDLSPSLPQTDLKQATNLFGDDKLNQEQSFFNYELSIWLLAAEIYIKIGHLEDAEMCTDEGSSYTNGALSYEVMFVRGLIAKAKSNLMEAKTFFQSCLALSPKHARALQQLAHVYFLLGNFVTAEKFLRDSLDLNSDCYLTWQYLGSVLIELNQYEMASDCNKKASSLEESSPIIPVKIIPRLTLE